MSYDSYDDTLAELRAEAAAERRRQRPHWCPECRGNVGSNSPCRPEEDDEQESEE